MSVFHNDMLAGSGGQTGGASSYQIARSLRFNSADSAYLSRTPSATSTSSTTCTLSFWMKRTFIGNNDRVFSLGPLTGVVNTFVVQISSDTIGAYLVTNTSYSQFTSAVLRDPSAWYHILFSLDTTQATASNRCRIYINGVQQASLTGAAPPQNHSINWGTGNTYYIGGDGLGGSYFSGYLADIHFIDGQALTPSSFGEFDSNGVWQPKAYTGSYGANGFRLDFSDNSSATSTGIGKDASGNGNNWTPTNLSVTAGAGNDSLVDSPTNYGTDTGAGGEVRGNYCTLNPLDFTTVGTLSNGNLDFAQTSSAARAGRATFGMSSGKWYWEYTVNTSGFGSPGIGRSSMSLSTYVGGDSDGWSYGQDGKKYNGNSGANYGSGYSNGNVIGIAYDADAGSLTFYLNGASQGVAYSGLSGTMFPAFSTSAGGSNGFSANFGQRPFAYAAPSGFKALCSTNLPTPTIPNGRTAMDVVTYTGNGGTQTISGLSFAPDLVWLKSRSAATAHEIVDIVRGATLSISSNTTSAEATDSNGLTAFTSSGFSLGTDSSYNNNAATYVAWTWDAGTTTVTNTAGTITSQVRANASAGISIVSWTGTTTGTIGHGLGVAPSLIIAKSRSSAATGWIVYSKVFGTNYYLILNQTDAVTYSASYWGASDPSSSTFGVIGTGYWNNNGSMIAYCFAPVSGFSAFGSYTGNGSADGVFVYTGFRPRWVLVKKTSASGPWIIYDTARNPGNVADKELRPNTSEQENGGTYLGLIDIVSNGFKIRSNTSAYVGEAGDFIYAAFAENPFSIARAR